VLPPCYLGDQEFDIELILKTLNELTRELWLITHKDLRNTSRVRAFFLIVSAVGCWHSGRSAERKTQLYRHYY
jgi:hypothetical protein